MSFRIDLKDINSRLSVLAPDLGVELSRVVGARKPFSDGVVEVIYVDSPQKMLKVIQEMGFEGEADFRKETGLSTSSKDLHGWWATGDDTQEPDPKDLKPHLKGEGFSFVDNRAYPVENVQIYKYDGKFYADAGDFM